VAAYPDHELAAMTANAAVCEHPAIRLAAQIAVAAGSLENLLVPVPQDRVVHAPWPEDLTVGDRAALLPYLGEALTHLGMCAEAIAAEPEIRGGPRNSLALVGHLLARAAGELGALQRGARAVTDVGRRSALPPRDFPNAAVLAGVSFPRVVQPSPPRRGGQQASRHAPQPGQRKNQGRGR
jgi:hypothetical protein